MESNRAFKPTITLNVSNMKLRVFRIGRGTKMKPWTTGDESLRSVHTHFTYEVFFVTHGSLEMKTQESTVTYERKVIIIPPDIGHYTAPDGDGCYCLLLSVEETKNGDAKAKYLNNLLSKGICELELSDDVAYYISAFSRKSDENSAVAEKDAELLAELIFREITGRLIAPSKSESRKTESWYVGTIETYINGHISGKITLSDIAAHVYLSNKQVSRIVKREFGKPLSELVTEKKLQSAKMLLKNTDVKVKDIATKVNIGGENYFYTLFKKHYGITPMEYRQSCREKDTVK